MTSNAIDDRIADRSRPGATAQALQVSPSAEGAAQQGLSATLSSRAAFWQPRHVQDSASLRHLPYLFWLVETCQPSRIVQLGLGDGVAFMGLCQAVDKLRTGGSCIGVATGETRPVLPPAFAREHDSHYADFSTIEASASDYWRQNPHQPDIDLLVIDCVLTEAMQTGLRADWLPRLSARGVLVILNPQVNASAQAGRDFLDSLKNAYATVGFLGGPDSPQTYFQAGMQAERLMRLSQLLPNSPDQLVLRQVFQRLGQSLELAESAKTRTEVMGLMQSKLDRLTETLDEREDLIGKLRNDLKASKESEKTQSELISGLQARFADTQARVTALETPDSSRAQEIEALQFKLTEAQANRQALYDRSTELQAERDQLSADLQTRTQDLAALASDYETRLAALQTQDSTRALEIASLQSKLAEAQEKRQAFYARSTELQAERDQLKNEVSERIGDISALVQDYEKRVASMQKEMTMAKNRVNKMEATISWRISGPFRKIKNAFRTKKT